MPDDVDMLNLLHLPRPSDTWVGWRDGVTIPYADFLVRVRQWQELLLDNKGPQFALYAGDSIEFAAALFGAWHAGKTVYLPSDTLPATCASLRQVVDGFLGEFPPECAPLSPLDAVTVGSTSFQSLQPDFNGLVVYTSGSTGAPQAIKKSLSQVSSEVATLEQLFGGEANAAEVLATVSHQHIYGLLFKVLWPLTCARPIHARSLTYPEELARATAACDCILVSSPAHLKRLPDSPAWVANAHRVRAVFSSGGPLPFEVASLTAQVLGCTPVEVYGSSETGGIGWRRRDVEANDSWTPMPGVEARISGEDDGVLEIRSPHLPDANWFRTADRAQISSEGRFKLRGRVDRIVKLEEKRISLDLIESQLKASPLVTEARVLVVAGNRQRLAAFVVLSEQGRKALAESGKHALNSVLREQLAKTVERIALPRSWRYLDALPVNAQGKTTQAELAMLLDDASAASGPTWPRLQLTEKEAQRALYELAAPHDMVYFEGHFPGTPIVPGVAQVDWALALACECFDLPPVFRGIHALKFQQVIRPESTFSLELMHDPAKGCVIFRYFSPSGTHASGRLMFGAADV
ncbi:MAG: Acyl-coenzyme synthetase/AMP-(fatty) acid ligase [Burkholderia sp.]|nr:Acyl-coenzyme synthetase/AMP-(fatty) acid ligase [Burkholderia sp.]